MAIDFENWGSLVTLTGTVRETLYNNRKFRKFKTLLNHETTNKPTDLSTSYYIWITKYKDENLWFVP